MQVLPRQRFGMDQPANIQELFEDHHDVVLQSAYRITGRSEDAEDVLQTVFVRLLKRKDVPSLGDRARAYLHKAAVNAALDIVRSRKTAPTVPLENLEPFLTGNRADHPDRLRTSAELRKWLRQALAMLGPRAAEVFSLKFLEGYSNQEIADLLGTSPGTVAVTLHRARHQLQGQIAALLGGKSNG